MTDFQKDLQLARLTKLEAQVKSISEDYWNLIDDYEADRLMVADKTMQRLIEGDDEIGLLLIEYKSLQAKKKAFIEIATLLDWILEGKELPDE